MKIAKAAATALLTVFALLYILPFLVTFSNSLMSGGEIADHYSGAGTLPGEEDRPVRMELIPRRVTLEQYREILWESPFYLNMFWNSVRIVLPVVLGQLAVSALAAYAFTVMRFRGKEGLFLLYIVVMLLPLQVTLVPNYIVADALGLETSELAIILPGIFNPLGVFLLRQYMKLLPAAYLESAMMDGANHGTAFLRVALPMALPGLACVALLTFIDYWNLIDQAVIFLRDAARQPMSLFLARINEMRMGVSFAGAVFYASPVLIVLYFGQEYLKRGISLSGLKG